MKKSNTFLKVLKVILIVILCLIILIAAASYVFLKTFDIKHYKPQIIAAATSALGRKVDFKDLDLHVSWNEGVQLKLNDITISDDPNFEEGSFLRIEEISLGADLLAYITQRQVSLSTIRVLNPQVKIIRNSNGALNISSLGAAAQTQSASPPAVAALPLIFIDGVIIENGSLSYIDQSQAGIGYNITQVGLRAQHISLYNTFPFALQAAVLSNTKNFLVAGTMKLNLKNQEVSFKNTKVSFELLQDAWEKIRYAVNTFTNVPLPGVLNGKFIMNVKELTAGAQGLKDCKIDAELGGGNLKFKDVTAGIAIEASQMAFKVTDFSLNEEPFAFTFSAGLFNTQPNISVSGTGALNLAKQAVQLNKTTLSVDLGLLPLSTIKESMAALSAVPLPEVLKGTLNIDVNKFSASPAGTEAIILDARLSAGTISMKEAAPGISFDGSKLSAEIVHFNLLGEPMRFAFSGALFGQERNFSTDGNVSLDTTAQKLHVSDLNVDVDLTHLPLAELKNSMTALKTVPMPEVLNGRLKGTFKDLVVSSQGVETLKGDVFLAGGKLLMKEAAPGISVDLDKIDVQVKDLSLGAPFNFTLAAAVFGSEQNIFLEGIAQYDPATQTIGLTNTDVSCDLSQISLAELKSSVSALKAVPLPETLSGKVHATLKKLSADPQGLKEFLLDAQVAGGGFNLNNIVPGVSLDATNVDVKVQDFALGNTPFQFSVRAALYGEVPNVVLTGQGQFDLTLQNMAVTNGKLMADLSKISLSRIQTSVAALKNVPLPKDIQGQLNATIDDLKVSPKGLTSLTMTGELTNGSLKLEQLALPLSSIHATFKVANNQAVVEDFSLKLGEGSLSAVGTIDDYLAGQSFTADLTLQSIDISKVIDQTKQPVKIEGTVNGKYHVKGQGFDSNKLTANLSGSGNLDMQNGKLKDINLLKEVVDKLSMFPNLKQSIEDSSGKYAQALQQKDTALNKVHLDSIIQNGAVAINPMEIESDGFLLKGQGTIDLNQTIAFETSFFIVEDLTASMIRDVQALSYLQNDSAQIQFPLKIMGKLSAPKVMPDIAYITQMAIKNRGKQELQKLLQKAIGGSGGGETSDQGQPQEKPAGQLINGILNSIFKK